MLQPIENNHKISSFLLKTKIVLKKYTTFFLSDGVSAWAVETVALAWKINVRSSFSVSGNSTLGILT